MVACCNVVMLLELWFVDGLLTHATLLPFARANLEIQHKLVDEFVDSLESPDEEYRREVLELMAEFIPLETRRDIAAVVLQGALGEEESQNDELKSGVRQNPVYKPKF